MKNGKCVNPSGASITYTEVRNFDDALDVLEKRHDMAEWKKKRALANEHRKPRRLTVASLLGFEKSRSVRAAKIAANIKAKTPHPFHDLTDEEKRDKMRAMFETGLWGIRTCAAERLAKKFAVPVGQAVLWLEDCEQRL